MTAIPAFSNRSELLHADEVFASLTGASAAGRVGPRRLAAYEKLAVRGIVAGNMTRSEWVVFRDAADPSASTIPGGDIPMDWTDLDGEIDRLLSYSRESLVDLYNGIVRRRPAKGWSVEQIVARLLIANAAVADQTGVIAARRRAA